MLNIICYIVLFIHALIYALLALINLIGAISSFMTSAFALHVVTILILMMSLNKSNKFKRLSTFLLIVSHAFMYVCFDPINGLAYLLFAFYWFIIFLRLQNQEIILFKKYHWLYKAWPILTLIILFLTMQDIIVTIVLLGFETTASVIIAESY